MPRAGTGAEALGKQLNLKLRLFQRETILLSHMNWILMKCNPRTYFSIVFPHTFLYWADGFNQPSAMKKKRKKRMQREVIMAMQGEEFR